MQNEQVNAKDTPKKQSEENVLTRNIKLTIMGESCGQKLIQTI